MYRLFISLGLGILPGHRVSVCQVCGGVLGRGQWGGGGFRSRGVEGLCKRRGLVHQRGKRLLLHFPLRGWGLEWCKGIRNLFCRCGCSLFPLGDNIRKGPPGQGRFTPQGGSGFGGAKFMRWGGTPITLTYSINLGTLNPRWTGWKG